MKAVVIGLGSMGKRRIRCLQSLGVRDILGVDCREDRREEARSRYGVSTLADLPAIWALGVPDVAIISLPPKQHVMAMKECVDRKVHFFVEASVVEDGLAAVAQSATVAGIVAAPSTTLRFHPAIMEIFRVVRSARLGVVSNVLLHSGQYLPDWHTYESVADYYVSDPVTGGAREIVPFEMTWFTELFGFPLRVAAQYRKTIEIKGAENIDDTYNCLLDYGSFLASVTVDVVSRHATRRLVINGDKGQLVWSWDDPFIRIYDGAVGVWTDVPYQMVQAADGYNKNIGENMYIEEMRAFLSAVAGKDSFPNSLERDHQVLRLLYAMERSDRQSCFVTL